MCVVIEGAGSPAEINLQSTDIVNMRVAEASRRGDAHRLRHRSWRRLRPSLRHGQLLPPEHRALIRGFVLNKFRGDARLLAPGPETLAQLTGVPTLAVLPMWREHGLPEEDGVFDARPSGSGLSVAVLAYPYISNLDEFTPLRNVPGLSLSWAREAQTIASADILVLPGSKHVAADLEWMRRARTRRGDRRARRRRTSRRWRSAAVCKCSASGSTIRTASKARRSDLGSCRTVPSSCPPRRIATAGIRCRNCTDSGRL